MHIDAALCTITDDPPSVNTVVRLSSMLGPVRVQELRHMLGQAGDYLKQSQSSAVHMAKEHLDRYAEGASQSGVNLSIEAPTIAQIRIENEEAGSNSLMSSAAILQALVWSVCIPPKRERPFIY